MTDSGMWRDRERRPTQQGAWLAITVLCNTTAPRRTTGFVVTSSVSVSLRAALTVTPRDCTCNARLAHAGSFALYQQWHQHRAAPWPEPNWRDDARCKRSRMQCCPVPRCSSLCTLRSGLASACALDDSLKNMLACHSGSRYAPELSLQGLRGSASLVELHLYLQQSTGDLFSLGKCCEARSSSGQKASRQGRSSDYCAW